MTTTIPRTEPATIVAGDTTKWIRALTDYPAPTWTLTYILVNAEGQITIAAADNGDDAHLVDLEPGTTAAYRAGKYAWRAHVSDGTDRYSVDGGAILIRPDVATDLHGRETRTHARRVYDAVAAVIEGRASSSQLSMSIDGIALTRMSHEELRDHFKFFRSRVVAEERLVDAKAGRGHGGRVLARL
jgi:hypothetical protein